MKVPIVVIAAVALSLVVTNEAEAMAQAAVAPSFQKLLEGAKREGKLVVWASTPNREKTHRLLLDAFNNRFGLQTRWEWVVMHPSQSVPRLIAEASAGRVSPDVLGPPSYREILTLLNAKRVKVYPWEQLDSELPGVRAAVDSGVKELSGIGLSWFDNVYGIAWNTKMIDDSKVPDRLEQLANPQWQGKLIVNVGGAGPFDLLSIAIGREKAIDLVKRIAAITPVLKKGTPAVTSALSMGEAPVALSSFFNAQRAIMNGEPVKFKFFEDYTAVGRFHIVVPEGSPNPNTARLFAAWMATEGIPIFEQEEIGGRITDPRSKVAKFIKDHAAKSKLIFPKTAKEAEQVEGIAENIITIFTGAR